MSRKVRTIVAGGALALAVPITVGVRAPLPVRAAGVGGCLQPPGRSGQTDVYSYGSPCISRQNLTMLPDAYENWYAPFGTTSVEDCWVYVHLRDDTVRNTVKTQAYDCTSDLRNGVHGAHGAHYGNFYFTCIFQHNFHTYVNWTADVVTNGQQIHQPITPSVTGPELGC